MARKRKLQEVTIEEGGITSKCTKLGHAGECAGGIEHTPCDITFGDEDQLSDISEDDVYYDPSEVNTHRNTSEGRTHHDASNHEDATTSNARRERREGKRPEPPHGTRSTVIATTREELLKSGCTLADFMRAKVLQCPAMYDGSTTKPTRKPTTADFLLEEVNDKKLECLVYSPYFVDVTAKDLLSKIENIYLDPSEKLVATQFGNFHPEFTQQYRPNKVHGESDIVDLVRNVLLRPALFGLHVWQILPLPTEGNIQFDLAKYLPEVLDQQDKVVVTSSEPLRITVGPEPGEEEEVEEEGRTARAATDLLAAKLEKVPISIPSTDAITVHSVKIFVDKEASI